MSNRCGCLKLNPIGLGFAIGVAHGLFIMAMAWAAWTWGFGVFLIQEYGTIFPGIDLTFNGGFYGLAWGILVGFAFGLVLGIIYNICLCCSSCRCCCCKPTDK